MSDTRRPPDGCLDAETIAALIDGRLDAEARAEVERHAASCPDCYEVFVDAVRTVPGFEARLASGAGRSRWRRPGVLVAGGALAAAAAVALAVVLPGYLARRAGGRPELGELVDAVGSLRPADARLTGGFAWGTLDTTVRTNAPGRLAPEVRIAAARLEQALDRERSAAHLAAFGTSRIVVGDAAGAIAALEEATALESDSAAYWSDLAAAHLAQSEATGDGSSLPRALDAAERALAIESALPEALFNKAVALERFGLADQAREAWTAYLSVDDASDWATEARRRLENLRNPPAGSGTDVEPLRGRLFGVLLRDWVDAAASEEQSETALGRLRATMAEIDAVAPDPMSRDLVAALERASASPSTRRVVAAAHDRFLRAQTALDGEAFAEALTGFTAAEAMLERAGSPLALTSRYHQGVIVYRRQDNSEAYRRFQALRPQVEARGYMSLRGRIDWMLGLLDALQGRRGHAAGHYDAAFEAFGAAGDRSYQAAVHGLMAGNYDGMGDASTGWRLRIDSIRRFQHPGPLLSASLSAARYGWPHAALAFAHAGRAAAEAANSAPRIADALRTEASIRASLGDSALVIALVSDARALLAGRDEPAWDRVRAEIALAEAQSAQHIGLDEGIRAAGEAMTYFTRTEAEGRLPELHAIRAGLHRQAGRIDDAMRDVRAGLALLADQRTRLANATGRATFEDAERHLLGEFVALTAPDGAAEEAFAAVDASRGRDVVGDATRDPVTIGHLQAALPGSTSLAAYVVGEDASFVWVVTEHVRAFHLIQAGRRALADLVRRVTPPADDPDALNALSALVLDPLEADAGPHDTLVIVPDGPLRALSFALLRQRNGRRLIEDRAWLVAPSAAAWMQATTRAAGTSGAPAAVLAIGNPAFDRAEYPGLRDLPQADAEARDVAARYGAPRTTVLRGGEATRDAVFRELAHAEIVHFAGHAVTTPWLTDASFLALAGPVPSRLTAAEVRELSLSRPRLVVLAACDTAAGGSPTLDSPLSLSRAFLAAGVPQVVGSLWAAGDRASRALFEIFHAEFARSGDAADSMRRAQAALAASGDPGLAAPRQWAGFVVMGGTRGR